MQETKTLKRAIFLGKASRHLMSRPHFGFETLPIFDVSRLASMQYEDVETYFIPLDGLQTQQLHCKWILSYKPRPLLVFCLNTDADTGNFVGWTDTDTDHDISVDLYFWAEQAGMSWILLNL